MYIIILSVLVGGCSGARLAKSNSKAVIKSAISSFIRAMNNEDIKTLEILYSDDFLSYEPNFKLPKKQLLNSIQKGFDQQNYQIEAKIMEIIGGSTVGSAHIKWKIIGEDQEVIFAKDLLQIWVKEKDGWKLSRILFFTINEVPDLENFNF